MLVMDELGAGLRDFSDADCGCGTTCGACSANFGLGAQTPGWPGPEGVIGLDVGTWVGSLDDGAALPMGTARGERILQWPAFWDDSRIVYQRHRTAPDGPGSADDHLWLVLDPATGLEFNVLGDGDDFYSDPEVLYKPGRGRMVATHYKHDDGVNTTWPAVPRVAVFQDLTTYSIEAFGGALTADGRDVEECHHPTWRPDGRRIACFGHEPEVPLTDSGGEPYTVRPIYELKPVAGQWVGTTPNALLFELPTPRAIPNYFTQSAAPELFPPPGQPGGCERYSWKYPSWCADQYIVATLYCEDGANPPNVVDSRIVLVDVDSGRHWDLTRFVEDFEGASPNTWRSMTAACAKDWDPLGAKTATTESGRYRL